MPGLGYLGFIHSQVSALKEFASIPTGKREHGNASPSWSACGHGGDWRCKISHDLMHYAKDMLGKAGVC